VTKDWFSELDTQHRQWCRTSPKPAHDSSSSGDEKSTGGLVPFPEVGPPRPRADHVRDIVVADDPSIATEIELLPPTVSVHMRREHHVNGPGLSAPPQDVQEVRVTKRERENVIVPERIAKEVEGIENRPATIFRKTGEGAAVIPAFHQDRSIVDALDAHAAIRKVPPVSFIWKTVKNRHPFVRSYLEFAWRREGVAVSLQAQ
jgi:hypothetical protein